MMRKIAIAALIALAVGPAFAQSPPAGTPTRIRGTVDKLDGQNLTVKSRDGQMLTIELAANVAVITLVKKSVADIKAGDYVASTGVKGTDGKIHAVEVRIFPEAARGTGEGQYPWDLMPDSIMTNATVGKVDQRPGSFLERTYEERQRKPDDLEAQEGQRPIAIHAPENLAHSDTGIVMLRRLLREQLKRIEEGLDPINVVRDPSSNKRIQTGAWNTILSPAEAAALPYSEDL